jgi:hypothetical protein
MRYATAGAFRTALERRLLTITQQAGTPLVRLRKLVVFDRLMARLLVVAPDRWILKGALALDFRLGDTFRTTKDLDLGRQDSEAAATADFLAAQAVDLGDYFSFAIVKAGRLDSELEGAAVRYRAKAELAGRPFEDVIVDVGFGVPIISAPELLQGPDLLSFAQIDRIEVLALSLEQHVAEKIHAYTRTYAGQRPSSRVKDLVDLVLIRSHTAFGAAGLRTALRTTFASRGTHACPRAMPPPPPDWGRAYRRMANDAGLNPDVSTGYEQVAAFLNPVLDETAPDEACWDPLRGVWELNDSDHRVGCFDESP